MSKKQNKSERGRKHSYVYSVIDADMKENPMPHDVADSILKKILSFFTTHRNNSRRNNNG